MRKPLILKPVMDKLLRLLPMNYRPAELAEELDVSVDTIYRCYLPAGAPHTRDGKGQIWIPGLDFAEWARAVFAERKRKKFELAPGQAWCMRCKKPVDIISPKLKAANRYITFMAGTCPVCGTKVNRAVRKGAKREGQ